MTGSTPKRRKAKRLIGHFAAPHAAQSPVHPLPEPRGGWLGDFLIVVACKARLPSPGVGKETLGKNLLAAVIRCLLTGTRSCAPIP
jgi:hypothetical protein